MAVSADRRVMPLADAAPDAKPPTADGMPNLFAPISTANRITGHSRVQRQHPQAQLIPGSSYDYGRSEYTGIQDAPPAAWSGEDAFGYQKSVPPTFLRRTMVDFAQTVSPAPGLHGLPVPDTLMDGYLSISQNSRQDPPYAGVTQDEETTAKPDFSAQQLPGFAPAAPARQEPPPQNSFAPPYRLIPAPPAQPYGAFAAPSPAAVTDVNTAEGYVPKHGGRNRQEPVEAQAAPERVVDPWEAMGWKTPEPQDLTSTAVWRVSDLSMFERNAFEEPLDPLRNPPATLFGNAGAEAYAIGDAQRAPDYAPAFYPGAPQEGEPYVAYDTQANAVYPPYGYEETQYAPYPPDAASPGEAYYPEGQESNAVYTPPLEAQRNRRAAPKPQARVRLSLATLGPWRVALVIGVSLALLFCVIEGAKMVQSLMANEQQGGNYLEEYNQLTGGESASAANGVELLPAGVTYAPTATPVAVQTPTPEPKIDQKDPLIGVIDSGGNQATQFQAALPSSTPATRTREKQYPDNALLSISEDFTTLRQENPDVVGRLTIDGVLDEVFTQRNNTFYLTHNARGVLSATGAIFVDESCTLKKPPENLLLRGQATTQGKLFAPLSQYETQGAAFLPQHGIVTCNTLYEQASYVIFAIVRADSQVNSPHYFNYAGYPTFQSDVQMMRYVDAARAHSIFKINVGVQASDRLLTLATVPEGSATNSLVILCRMLRSGESAANIQQN